MIELFVMFWTVMILTSIAWYGFLLFYIGYKGGRELKIMTKTFAERDGQPPNRRN